MNYTADNALIQFVGTLTAAILLGAISAWITSWLALRRIRSERWWERKVDVYSQLIDALHGTKSFSSNHIEANVHDHDLPEDKDSELRVKARKAAIEIERLADIGRFFLHPNATARLRQFQRESDKARDTTDWVRFLQADYDAAESCLADVAELAKQDLKVG